MKLTSASAWAIYYDVISSDIICDEICSNIQHKGRKTNENRVELNKLRICADLCRVLCRLQSNYHTFTTIPHLIPHFFFQWGHWKKCGIKFEKS